MPSPSWRAPRGWSTAAGRRSSGGPARPCPRAEEEVWRYSRIDELDLDRFAPAAGGHHRHPRRPRPGRGAAGRRRRPSSSASCPSRATRSPGSTTRWPPTRSSSTCRPASPCLSRSWCATRVRPTAPRRRSASSCGPGPTARSRSSSCSTAGERACSCPPPRSTSAAPPALGYVGAQLLDPATWSIAAVDLSADAQATVTAGLVGFGGDYARVRTDCRLLGRGATGNLVGRLLRRRRPDARLPHLPGPRGARHHQQPAVQGRRERPVPVRVHGPDPGREGRAGHATPSRRTATSSSPRTPGPSPCPTS